MVNWSDRLRLPSRSGQASATGRRHQEVVIGPSRCGQALDLQEHRRKERGKPARGNLPHLGYLDDNPGRSEQEPCEILRCDAGLIKIAILSQSLPARLFQISRTRMRDGLDFGLAHSPKVLPCRPPPSQPKSIENDRPQPASNRRACRQRRVIGPSELHSSCVTGLLGVGGTGARGAGPANEGPDLDADSGQHPSLLSAIGRAPALSLFSITRA